MSITICLCCLTKVDYNTKKMFYVKLELFVFCCLSRRMRACNVEMKNDREVELQVTGEIVVLMKSQIVTIRLY